MAVGVRRADRDRVTRVQVGARVARDARGEVHAARDRLDAVARGDHARVRRVEHRHVREHVVERVLAGRVHDLAGDGRAAVVGARVRDLALQPRAPAVGERRTGRPAAVLLEDDAARRASDEEGGGSQPG